MRTIGSRRDVWLGFAKRTGYGKSALERSDLKMKGSKLVSIRASKAAKRNFTPSKRAMFKANQAPRFTGKSRRKSRRSMH
jgi:hypothetical protein